MSRPPLEVADIFRACGAQYRQTHRCSPEQLAVMDAIEICRTAELGGRVEKCDQCGHRAILYNSCRNRHCPKCGWLARMRWLEERQAQLLPVGYFHVVFTVPEQIVPLALQNKRVVYNILFAAVSQTLLTIAADPKHLGALIGFLAVLHTWGQVLLGHPHVHCVVPAGGVSQDGSRWICPKGKRFFLPIGVLSKMFRGKFLTMLKQALTAGKLKFHGSLAPFNDARKLSQYLRPLYRRNWVVYCKAPFGSPEQVLKYLGRYTHRIAITNDRLLALQDNTVSFSYKDYRDGSKIKSMTLDADEFIRRFLLHVLPQRFVRIRHYGFLANARREKHLDRCRRLLDVAPSDPLPQQDWKERYYSLTGQPVDLCPCCKTGRMIQIEILAPVAPLIDSS